jgi:hypothetical protein
MHGEGGEVVTLCINKVSCRSKWMISFMIRPLPYLPEKNLQRIEPVSSILAHANNIFQKHPEMGAREGGRSLWYVRVSAWEAGALRMRSLWLVTKSCSDTQQGNLSWHVMFLKSAEDTEMPGRHGNSSTDDFQKWLYVGESEGRPRAHRICQYP